MRHALALASLLLFAPEAAFAASEGSAASGEPAREVVRETVPVLPPMVAPGAEGEDLAIAIQTFAAAALAETGRFHEVHVKQVLRMAELEGLPRDRFSDPEVAIAAARHLGASRSAPLREPRVVFSRLEKRPKGWALFVQIAAGDKFTKPTKVELPASSAEAVDRAVAAILGVLDADKPLKGKVKAKARKAGQLAHTTSAEAMKAFAACWRVLVQQPMGVENPSVLKKEEIARAIESCKASIAADPAFTWAHAALGLALAIRGDDEEAVKQLAPLKATAGHLPPYWIARFWLVTRYQSNEAGAGVLREAIEKSPGFLLARGYLGELLDTVHDYDGALKAWTDYQTVAPDSNFARANLAFTLSKLRSHPQAIALAKEALDRDPDSRVLKWEVAGRFLDAGMVRWAIDILGPLSELPGAGLEVKLRLGEAYFDGGMLEEARATIEKALQASRPAEDRRTRRHAFYRLAKIALARGVEAEAEKLVRQAASEGYKPDTRARLDPQLMVVVRRVDRESIEVKAPEKKASLTVKSSTTTTARAAHPVSPFAVDDANEIRPLDKTEPPPGFELIKF